MTRRNRGKMNRYSADMERRLQAQYQERIVASAVLGGMELVLGHPMGYYLPSPTGRRVDMWEQSYATQYKAARAWLRQKGITI